MTDLRELLTEEQTLRARIRELEAELEAAVQHIARLELEAERQTIVDELAPAPQWP